MDFRELIEFKEVQLSEVYKIYLERFYSLKLEPARRPNWLHFDDGLIMEILAGYNGCCTPKKNINIYKYTSFQVGIFYPDCPYLNMRYIERFKDFKYRDVLSDCFSCGLYAYVPTTIVQKLFDYLDEKLGLIKIQKEGF